jgi:hypothetical protein
VVLVRDRCSEQSHDAVARVLVDRPLEAMHALSEDLEEAVHDLVPLFGVDLLGEVHRPLHVGEQHRHLLALAFDGAAGGEDRLGEVLWGVGRGSSSRGHMFPQRCTAVAAELLLYFNGRSAGGAGAAEPTPALRAEAAVGTIAVSARRTGDSRLRFHDCFAPAALPELVIR